MSHFDNNDIFGSLKLTRGDKKNVQDVELKMSEEVTVDKIAFSIDKI